MQSWIIKHSEMMLTVLISLMICTTRSSMALGNLIYSLIILMTLVTCWYRRHEISVPQSIRQYGMGLCRHVTMRIAVRINQQ